jgi:uncharacterized protein (TIGR02452 family)
MERRENASVNWPRTTRRESVLALADEEENNMSSTKHKLHCLPCLDSPELADRRRKELDISRYRAVELGKSAVKAARAGYYLNTSGEKVDWSDAVASACMGKRSIPPDELLPSQTVAALEATTVQVTNETTLGAAQRMMESGLRPLALNFANGISPGGGFLHGALAQEESLCRSSCLYQTLLGDPMYDAHRERELPDSTDWAIYSPDVPVFRSDDGVEINQPWLLSFLTCAAPYAPDVGQPESGDLLEKRIHRVLEIARSLGYTSLILGAWGCGAFDNDIKRTARDFRRALKGHLGPAFSDIVFAITDWSKERRYLGPFRDIFAADGQWATLSSWQP